MRRFIVEVSNEQFELISDLKNLRVILFNAYVLYNTDTFILTVRESFKENRMEKRKVLPSIAQSSLNQFTVNDIAIILQKCECEGEAVTLGLSRVL